MTQLTTEEASDTSVGALKLSTELSGLKVIGVEEHMALPDVFRGVKMDNFATTQYDASMKTFPGKYLPERVADVESLRLPDMNNDGVAVQILSLTSTINTTHFLDGRVEEGVKLAKAVNDRFKAIIDQHPTRFRALADLPMQHPEEAVKELYRAVKELGFVGAMISGSIGGDRFLDSPEFDPILSAFESLGVPLYLHPGIPLEKVWNAYYDIPGRPEISRWFGMAGWGWHNEVAIHVLRLILTGTLDRHPRLKIVIGHQGEMIPEMLQRIETCFDPQHLNLKRSVQQTLRSQVWIAISGFFYLGPTQLSISTWGIDRVLFAVDYPYINQGKVPEFIRALSNLLAPEDVRKVCQTNAERLFKFQA